MASERLYIAWESYYKYIEDKGLTDEIIQAMISCTKEAYKDGDLAFAYDISTKTKEFIRQRVSDVTKGGTWEMLEDYAQENKQNFDYINWYYDVLWCEAPYYVDSFKLYIERDRKRKDRFYEPRRKTLKRISDAIQRLENDELDILFLHQPPRTGKLLADSTPVFTSNGWKTHGELVVGDKVIGSDGNFTEITAVFPKDVANYKVTLSNGEEIFCHGNHEWTVWNRSAQRVHTYETHEMISKLHKAETKRGKRVERNNIYLPYRQPMVGTKREFALNPYVLGAWLGDGTNTKPWITDPIEDFAIIEKVIMCGYPLRKVYTHKTTGVKSYVFDSKMMKDLQNYGMCYYDKTHEKHIPIEYLTASFQQRLELLAGLLDTDGTLVKKERRYHFSTVSERLKDDFVTLIHTFGWRACVTICKPHKSSFGIEGKRDCYVIAFNPTFEIPCVLERKHLTEFSQAHRISIESIEPCEEIQGNCISVSNFDGLYAVGRTMQLTHNSGDLTMDVAWHCARDTENSNLYVTYKEGLGGAFIDGVIEMFTDPTYRFADVFPQVKITATDAKNNKLDLGTDKRRRKKYKSLSGKGLESGLNGEYDASGWLIIDDPLEGVQDVMSKEVLKRKQEIFDNNVLSRAKEKCKIILMGTIWDEHDIFSTYKEFLELHKGELRVEEIRIPALDPDTDESNFDYDYGVGFSTEHYRRIRSKHELNDDMAGWLAQYQQDPIPREGAVFNPQHMNYYSELPEGEPIKKIAHCDVALGGGDFLSFPIAYYYELPDGSLRGYVTDVVFDNSEKHVTQPQVVGKIIKHNLKNANFESNQGGEGYKDDVVILLKEKKYRCNLTSNWAPTQKRKEQRIWDNAQDIRELYYLIPEKRDMQYRKFMNNLFSFSMNMKKRDHDDAADSLSGLIDYAEEGSGVSTAVIMRSPI